MFETDVAFVHKKIFCCYSQRGDKEERDSKQENEITLELQVNEGQIKKDSK